MIHGTDCGSTPVEAANSVHAAFEQQLKNWAMKQQQGANILKDMQKLYHDEFRRAYGWDGSEPHFLYPPTEDPALLNGQALLNAGRATAIVFWEHQQAGHSEHHTEQLTPELEITSMPVNTRVELECALWWLRATQISVVDCESFEYEPSARPTEYTAAAQTWSKARFQNRERTPGTIGRWFYAALVTQNEKGNEGHIHLVVNSCSY